MMWLNSVANRKKKISQILGAPPMETNLGGIHSSIWSRALQNERGVCYVLVDIYNTIDIVLSLYGTFSSNLYWRTHEYSDLGLYKIKGMSAICWWTFTVL